MLISKFFPYKWERGKMVGNMNRVLVYIVFGLVIGLLMGGFLGYFMASSRSVENNLLFKTGKFTYPPKPGEKVVIVYGFDANYPPFTKILPNGSVVGFDVDVVNWIADKYGWKIIYKPWDWSTIVDALVRGDIDIIASGMTITAARSEKIWFSLPYYTYVHVLVVSARDTRSLKEVLNSGEYIAVQLGSTSDEWAERLLKEGYRFKKLGLNSYSEAIEAVLDGRAIAAISDSAFIYPYFERNPDKAGKLKILTTIGPPYAYGIATRPEDKWLRDMINRALEELMNSPEWDKLLKKWGLK
jgi:polar amino acid transport system substrate-binding protein